MNKVTFLVETTFTGYSAVSLDQGIAVVGATPEELTENAVTALALYLEETGSPQPVTAANLNLLYS